MTHIRLSLWALEIVLGRKDLLPANGIHQTADISEVAHVSRNGSTYLIVKTGSDGASKGHLFIQVFQKQFFQRVSVGNGGHLEPVLSLQSHILGRSQQGCNCRIESSQNRIAGVLKLLLICTVIGVPLVEKILGSDVAWILKDIFQRSSGKPIFAGEKANSCRCTRGIACRACCGRCGGSMVRVERNSKSQVP